MTDRTSTDHLLRPDDDATAALLRRALLDTAEELQPADRLGDIRARVGRRRVTWQRPVLLAAAATVVAVGGAALVTGRPAGPARPSTPAASTPAPSTIPVDLPVYYLGADGDRQGLYREVHRVDVLRATAQSGITPELLALDLALDGSSALDDDYGAPWLPETRAVTRISRSTDGAVLSIDLPADEEQPAGRSRELARLAVQQLVWTATAAADRPELGVRVTIDGAPGRLFGALEVGGVLHRPDPTEPLTDLARVWVLSPQEGATTASPVTVSGSACTFEASLQWQLVRDGTLVRSGHTMAASGCPVRGTWSVALGDLDPGSYTFRAYAEPPSGEGAAADDTKTFTVE